MTCGRICTALTVVAVVYFGDLVVCGCGSMLSLNDSVGMVSEVDVLVTPVVRVFVDVSLSVKVAGGRWNSLSLKPE